MTARGRPNGGGTLVLDAEGLVKLASSDVRARRLVRSAVDDDVRVVVSAATLAEVMRGGSGDAFLHRALKKVETVPVTLAIGRHAGALLGASKLSGHQHAIDALVAATAHASSPPVVILTSDPKDLARLADPPGPVTRPRIAVIAV